MEEEPYTEKTYEEVSKKLFNKLSQNISAFDNELSHVMEHKLAPQADFTNVISVTEFWCNQMLIGLHRDIHDAGLCTFLYKFKAPPAIQYRNEDGDLNKVTACLICIEEQ